MKRLLAGATTHALTCKSRPQSSRSVWSIFWWQKIPLHNVIRVVTNIFFSWWSDVWRWWLHGLLSVTLLSFFLSIYLKCVLTIQNSKVIILFINISTSVSILLISNLYYKILVCFLFHHSTLVYHMLFFTV
jgi:hypothetical protein